MRLFAAKYYFSRCVIKEFLQQNLSDYHSGNLTQDFYDPTEHLLTTDALYENLHFPVYLRGDKRSDKLVAASKNFWILNSKLVTAVTEQQF